MPIPLKDHSVSEIEEAVAVAVQGLTGEPVTVKIGSMEFNEGTSLAKISISVWVKMPDLAPGGF
jgi:hypothetical protein